MNCSEINEALKSSGYLYSEETEHQWASWKKYLDDILSKSIVIREYYYTIDYESDIPHIAFNTLEEAFTYLEITE